MEVEVQLADLNYLHPELEWRDLIGAAAILLGEKSASPFQFKVEISDVPSFDDDILQLAISADGLNLAQLAKQRRTLETSRLVELAAIALGGLALYHAAGQEIVSVAASSTGADYALAVEGHLLEVTGRSRRRNFESAWSQHWSRLTASAKGHFYLFAAEFQTPKGRLAFQP
jgi:hypothetical protein